MKLSMLILGLGVPALGVLLAVSPAVEAQDTAAVSAISNHVFVTTDVADTVSLQPGITPDAHASSILVYIKVVIQKEFGWVAKNLGGMRDNTWRRTLYRPSNHWWENPLIVHNDPLIVEPDIIMDSDAQSITGAGSSKNIKVRVNLVPHAELTVKTIPPSDAVQGTISCVISARASYYDGKWVEMVHEVDRTVTFLFDSRDPAQAMEVIDVETRTVPLFVFERYTRDQIKWEPKSRLPSVAVSGDWHVAIYGKNAVLKLTRYRHVQPDNAISTLPPP